MDAAKINEILHRDKIQQSYRTQVGSDITIAAPRLPMTRYTQFISVETEKKGDVGSFRVYKAAPKDEEGILALRDIGVQSLSSGTLQLSFVARDRLTGEAIEGVEPVNVIIEAA